MKKTPLLSEKFHSFQGLVLFVALAGESLLLLTAFWPIALVLLFLTFRMIVRLMRHIRQYNTGPLPQLERKLIKLTERGYNLLVPSDGFAREERIWITPHGEYGFILTHYLKTDRSEWLSETRTDYRISGCSSSVIGQQRRFESHPGAWFTGVVDAQIDMPTLAELTSMVLAWHPGKAEAEPPILAAD